VLFMLRQDLQRALFWFLTQLYKKRNHLKKVHSD
jgi:hypothetical protein